MNQLVEVYSFSNLKKTMKIELERNEHYIYLRCQSVVCDLKLINQHDLTS